MLSSDFPLRVRIVTHARPRRAVALWPVVLALFALAAFGALRATPAAAQVTPGAVPVNAVNATRAQLTASLAAADRRGARDDAARIRSRLAAGDFHAGDRVTVQLTVDSTRELTFVVRDSDRVDVPNLGSLSLRGVLRSELQPTMLRFFQQYYKQPDVRTQTLVRVGVLGAVARPGYYSIAPDALLTDLLAGAGPAGGPAGNANTNSIEVKRGNQTVLKAKAYQRAARDGLTIDDAGVRSGDELRVPERKNRSVGQIIQTVLLGLSVFTSLIFLIRAANNQ